MAGLLIRDIPPELYERLKASAKQHHRSINKEALTILEAVLESANLHQNIPVPLVGRFPITDDFLYDARNEGRP